MKWNYLYIEDEKDEIAKGIISNIRKEGILEIKYEPALSWNEQVSFIKKHIDEYDGVLLDLKLEFPIEGQQLLHYAPELAQGLRSLMKRKEIKELPIFLCSTDDKLRLLYDKTGEDLFDECFDKTRLSEVNRIAFVSHAEAYQEILKQFNNVEILLQIKKEDSDILEEAKSYFNQLTTVHEKARFLLRQVIEPTGILIDEDVLAIRLGINKDKSKEKWEDLKKEFKKFEYRGIYSTAYPRWWMRGVFQWWDNHFPDSKPIMLLTAEERVEKLKTLKFDGIIFNDLNPFLKIEHQKSTKFWYKCISSKLKIDPQKNVIPIAEGDGFSCLPNKYTWQDRSFVSYNYAYNSSADVAEEIRNVINFYEMDLFNEILSKRD